MEQIVIEQTFLNGLPNGIVRITKDNWSGMCFKIPNLLIKEIKNIEVLKNNPAIYFLFGEKEGQECVYVGETEDLYKRLNQHKTDKYGESWNMAVAFVGMSEWPLEKAQIKYLENLFYNDCKREYTETKIYNVLNDNNPTQSKLSENSKIKANKFALSIKFILNAIGYRLFENKVAEKRQDISDYYKIDVKGIVAYGNRTLNGFVVKKGSMTAQSYTEATTECFKIFGKKLRDTGVIVNNKFVVDYEFKTPSAAAVAVLGHNCNGLKEWKKDGKTLKNVEEYMK